MRFLPWITALGSASAYLLVPAVSTEYSKEAIESLVIENVELSNNHIMYVYCPGCPVPEDIDGAAPGLLGSFLLFNFTISSRRPGADRLLLNDYPMYPLSSSPNPLTASQHVLFEDGTWRHVANQELVFMASGSMHLRPIDKPEPVEITVYVREVNGKEIQAMEGARVHLSEDPSGKLIIEKALLVPSFPPLRPFPPVIKQSPSTPPPPIYLKNAPGIHKLPAVPTPHRGTIQRCRSLICKVKAFVSAKLSGWKHPEVKGCAHSKKSGFSRFVHRVMLPILFVIATVIAGTLMGTAIGFVTVFLCRSLFRRNPQGGEYQELEQGESKSLVEHQSPLPIYKDTPACEEVASDEKKPIA